MSIVKFIVILHLSETFPLHIIEPFCWQCSFGKKTHWCIRELFGTVGLAKIIMW